MINNEKIDNVIELNFDKKSKSQTESNVENKENTEFKSSVELDDEAVIELISNDEIIGEIDTSGIFQQGENVILYKLEGLYKDDSAEIYKKKGDLLREPPRLTFENSNGEFVEIAITKNFAIALAKEFNHIENGYRGLQKIDDSKIKRIKDIPDMIKSIPQFFLNFKEQKIKVVVASLIIIGLIIMVITGLF